MKTTDDAELPSALVRLELSPSAVSIAVARSVIRRIVVFCDEDAESSFLIAFTEILANAIDEHRRHESSDLIVVEIRQAPVELVRVADAGTGMTGDRVENPSVVDAAFERGRGLALARAFVDDLEFESSSVGTAVSLPLARFGIVR